MSDEPILLSAREAARLLSVSPSTVYQLIARREIPFVQLGTIKRIARRDIEAMTGIESYTAPTLLAAKRRKA